MRMIFTTGQIASLLGVAPKTVCKWIDTRQLKSYRLPGRGDRRVTRAALLKFLAEIGATEMLAA